MEMTLDQQKAVAIATARLRIQQGATPPPPDIGTTSVDQAQAAFDAQKPGVVSRFLGSAADTATGMVSGAYHAFTDPATPEESKQFGNQPGPIELGLKRTLVDPSVANYEKFRTAPNLAGKIGYGLGMIPVVGPLGTSLGETAADKGLPEAAGQAAVFALAPKAIEKGMGAAGEILDRAPSAIAEAPKTASDFLRDRFKPTPEVAALRATGPSVKPEVRAAIPRVLAEVGQWADETGQKVETAPQFRKAIDERIQYHTKISDAIAEPHNNSVVEGSRAEMAQAKIDAIPDDIRSEKPGQYANIVKSIKAAADQPDYTIGDLNDLRKSLNTKNKAFGKNRTGAMAAEYSTNAIDQAAGDYARNKFYDALEKVSGQGEIVRELKKSTGDLMVYDNALRGRENQSVVESGKPFMQRAVETAGKALTPGTTLKHFGENATIDSDLASAVRQYKGRPPQILRAPTANRLALPPASGAFEIDPSAVSNYQQGNAADVFRTQAQPGEGIPMRDVTPPKQKLLQAAPAKITTYIQRSSGKTYQMPASVSGLLEQYLEQRKAQPTAAPKQLTASTVLKGGAVEAPIVNQMADHFMLDFAERIETGDSDLTGKLKAQDPNANYGYDDVKSRFKGGYKNGTPWEKFSEGPAQIAKAIRSGKGPLYERIKKAAMEASKDAIDEHTAKQNEQFNAETKGWD